MTGKFKQIWQKLAKSKRYREQFVAAQVKRGIPFQIRALMKNQGLSQEKLAAQAQLTQGVISRAADPNNGNLTLNTVIRIAAGFDVAFIGMFVPFSDLVKWYSAMSEKSGAILNFTKEDEKSDLASEMESAGAMAAGDDHDDNIFDAKKGSGHIQSDMDESMAGGGTIQ